MIEDVKWLETIQDYNNRISSEICVSCGKPIEPKFSNGLCSKCNLSLKSNGLHSHYIPFSIVGNRTTEIQQSLHRRFFNCNVNYKYRGNKIDRLYVKDNVLSQSIINTQTALLYTLLTEPTIKDSIFKISIDQTQYHHYQILQSIKNHKNFIKRILYNLTLYAYLYYIKNSTFKDDNHFKASFISHLFTNIQTGYSRIIIGKNNHIEMKKFLHQSKYERTKYPNKYYYTLYNRIIPIVSIILSKLYYAKPLYTTNKNLSSPFSKHQIKTKPSIILTK